MAVSKAGSPHLLKIDKWLVSVGLIREGMAVDKGRLPHWTGFASVQLGIGSLHPVRASYAQQPANNKAGADCSQFDISVQWVSSHWPALPLALGRFLICLLVES